VSLMTKAKVSKGSEQVRAQAVKAQAQARQMRAQAVKAQQQARQTAAQVAPFAASARITAAERLRSARAWTAPRLERTGTALQERIAPSVSAMLTRAARRIEPQQARRRRRWPFLAAGLIVAGAATAGAAALRGRLNRGQQGQGNDPSERPEATQAPPQQADSTAAAVDANGRVRTH
jgi:hypothetical protein